VKNLGFHKCEEDHCCYVKKYVDSYIITSLYVDDILIVGANMEEIDWLKKHCQKILKWRILVQPSKFLVWESSGIDLKVFWTYL